VDRIGWPTLCGFAKRRLRAASSVHPVSVLLFF
jgi:hypothetical protein